LHRHKIIAIIIDTPQEGVAVKDLGPCNRLSPNPAKPPPFLAITAWNGGSCKPLLFDISMATARPSTLAWVGIHLVTPLTPFMIEGLLRLAVNEGSLTLNTFRAPTLAMSMGLLSAFVNQSLRTFVPQLADERELESIAGASAAFTLISVAFFVLFGVLALLGALVIDRGMTALYTLLRVFQTATFIGCAVPITTAIVTQRSFKLRASVR
jgi:hypothetical protein